MPFTESDVDALLAEGASPATPPAPDAQPPRQPLTEADVDGLLAENEASLNQRLYGILTVSLPQGQPTSEGLRELSARTGRKTGEWEGAKYEELAKQWQAARQDVARFRRESPGLANMLLENPALTETVVKDQQLSIFSKAWNWWADSFIRGQALTSRAMDKAAGASDTEANQKASADATQMATALLVTPKSGTFRRDSITGEAAQQSGLERVGTILGATWRQSSAGMERSKLGWELMQARTRGDNTYSLENRIQDLALESIPRDFSAGPVEQALADVVEGASSQLAVYEDAAPMAAMGGVLGAAAGAAVTRTPAGAKEGAKLGAKAFSAAGVAWGSLKLEAGSAYLEYRTAKTDDGQAVSEEETRGAALLYGALASGVEVGSFSYLLSNLGRFGDAVKAQATKQAMAEMLRSQGLRHLARQVGHTLAESAGSEFTEEVVQAALQDATSYVMRSKSAGELQQMSAPDVEGYLLQGQKAAVGAMGTTLAITSVQAPVEAMRVQRSLSDGKRVSAIAGLKDSPTARAAPAAVAKLIEESSGKGGNPITALYVDAQAFTEAVLQQGAQPEEVARELMGEDGPKLLQGALDTGSKLEVPVQQYLEKWGVTSLGETLAEDTATSQSALTTRQARRSEAMSAAVLSEVNKRGAELVAQYGQAEAPATVQAEVFSQLSQQLEDAGRSATEAKHGAALVVALMERLAEVTKQPVEQVLAGYALRVQREGQQADFIQLGKRLVEATQQAGQPAAAEATPAAAPPAPIAATADTPAPATPASAEASTEAAAPMQPTETATPGVSPPAAAASAPEATQMSASPPAPVEPASPATSPQAPLEAAAAAVEAYERMEELANASGLSGALAAADQLTNVLKQGPLLPSGPARPGALAESRPLSRPGTPAIGPKTTATHKKMREHWEGLALAAKQVLFLIDSNTGLLNERSLEALKTHEGRPYLAEFDLEGGKLLNDAFGHASVDGALRLMARGLSEAGITDGVVRKGSVLAWVRDEAHAREVAATLQRVLRESMPADVQAEMSLTPQGGLQVTVGVALGQETLDASLKATGAAHKATKDEAIKAKTLGLRSVAPRFLLPAELPDIAAEKGLPGLQPDSAEVKAFIRAAAESGLARRIAEALAEAEKPADVPLTPELLAAFDEAGRTEDPFLTVYIHPTGLLTAEGFNLVRTQPFRKAMAASGDMRALRPINDALGREGADDVLLAFQQMLARNVPDGVDVAWPHGDEFLAQADTEAELKDMFKATRTAASQLVFVHQAKRKEASGETRDGINLLDGVQFAYGIDADIERADRVALPAAKAEQGDARQPEWVDGVDIPKRYAALAEAGKDKYVVDVGLGRVPRPGVQASNGANPSGTGSSQAGASSGSHQVGDGTTLHSDGQGEQPRGYVQLGRTADGRTFSINLTDIADRSTFLHETGHFFLEVFADFAEKPDAPAQLQRDFQSILEWFGVASRADITTAQHEKWATAFETYLREGNAPSAALRRAFARFKKWLTDLYRQAPHEQLPPDVTGVFDRLLAAEDETARVRQQAGLKRMFRTPSEAGMTPEAFQQYLRDEEAATSTAQQAVEMRLMKDELQELDAEWTAEREKLLEEADAAYEALPARQAQLALDAKDVDTGKPMRLDRRYVEERLKPSEAKRFRLTKKGGTHPDEVAAVYGYATGEEMLRAVLSLPEKKAWTEKQADAKLAEARGDLMADRTRLREAVAKGLHGDATAAWLMQELESLQRRAYQLVFNPEANKSQAIPNQQLGLGPTPELELRAAAKAIALSRKARTLDAGRVRMEERRAAQAAMVAAAQGNFAQAFNLKKQQLLNFFLHRELEEAVKDRDALLDFAAQHSKDKVRARLGKASPTYRDGIEMLLTAFKLKMRSDAEDVLPSLNEVVDALSSDAVSVGFDVEPLAKQAARGTPWKQLSVAEMRNLLDALNNIRTAALRKATALVDGKRVDKDTLTL